MPETAPLHIVDVSTYMFRAYHKLPPSLTLPDGGAANALYGTLGTLAKLIREKKVTRLAPVLDDVAADEERIALSPGYKSSRREFPPDIESQFALLPDALAAAGFASALVKGWEADDVVATIAARAHEAGESIVIVGADKDLLQVLRPGDHVYDLGKDRLLAFEEANVVLGVPPGRTADFLALSGDPVDEIPGVPGIGKKTAAALVNALGSVADIYRDLDRVLSIQGLRGAASVRQKLELHEPDVRRALVLATLKPTAPLSLGLDAFAYRGTTEEGRKILRERFGFERLSERFPRAS